MRRLLSCLLVAGALAPVSVAAQSSQFGIRGLGFPNVPYSARTRGMGGSVALFDAESALNPASLSYLSEMTAGFSVLNDSRSVDNPAGTGTLRSMRFPIFSIAAPLRKVPLAFGISASTFFARDFSTAFRDSIVIRGVPTATLDTLTSTGGLNDLRAAVVWKVDARSAIGGSIHAYTGVERITRARWFQDTGYVSLQESSEVSAAGAGIDLGFIRRLSPRLTLAGVVRADGHLTVRRDSLKATEYPVDLPYSFALGAQYRPTSRLLVAAQGRWQGWSSADKDLLSVGGTGANDVWEVGVGGEFRQHPDRPARLPLRFGVRHTTLPFPLITGGSPSETAATLGTGFAFREGMGGFDASLERVWRSEGSPYKEQAWLFAVTATLRPNRRSR